MSKLVEIPIGSVRPTQLTIGYLEVAEKKKNLLALKPDARRAFLTDHPVPTVFGPGNAPFITDHHHLARAALEADVHTVFCQIDADLSASALPAFWNSMAENSWVHPLDENGVRHIYDAIPLRLEQLVDDVYRSLAGFVRDAGGFDKTPTAFAEFVWADFFRRNVAVERVRADFHAAVKLAMPLAQGHLAHRLPGFNGK